MARFLCKTLALLIIIIIVALDEGCGLPLSRQAEAAAESPQAHLVRTKRCSCNSWDDKECIYFCHLDIIWVNTPSKVLPYGLGSPLSRRRRSADRCQCANPDDATCSDFCHDSSDHPKADDTGSAVKSTRLSSNKLLRYLRSVVMSNEVLDKAIPSKANPAKVKQLKNWTIR